MNTFDLMKKLMEKNFLAWQAHVAIESHYEYRLLQLLDDAFKPSSASRADAKKAGITQKEMDAFLQQSKALDKEALRLGMKLQKHSKKLCNSIIKEQDSK